jgi:hypothetical protein
MTVIFVPDVPDLGHVSGGRIQTVDYKQSLLVSEAAQEDCGTKWCFLGVDT